MQPYSGIELATQNAAGRNQLMMKKEELRFLTLAEVASLLQVSKRTLLRMIQQKKLPALKVGGQWRIPESRFRKWVEHNENLIPGLE